MDDDRVNTHGRHMDNDADDGERSSPPHKKLKTDTANQRTPGLEKGTKKSALPIEAADDSEAANESDVKGPSPKTSKKSAKSAKGGALSVSHDYTQHGIIRHDVRCERAHNANNDPRVLSLKTGDKVEILHRVTTTGNTVVLVCKTTSLASPLSFNIRALDVEEINSNELKLREAVVKRDYSPSGSVPILVKNDGKNLWPIILDIIISQITYL